jgi:FMN phosphatase YigB (HAD superfamily)
VIKAVIFDLSGVLIESEFQDDNFRFAEQLKGKYKLGILSNLSCDHSDQLKDRGFYQVFDVIHLLGGTRFPKPYPESYLSIIKEMKVEPQETVFIDDSLDNVEQAEKLGIKTIHYCGSDNLKNIFKKNEKGWL